MDPLARSPIGEDAQPLDPSFLLLDEAPVLIWRSAADGKRDYVNRSWLEFTGRTREQELGYGWSESVHAGDLPRCLEVYFSAVSEHRPFQIEYRLRRQQGDFRWMLEVAKPLFDAAGTFTGHLGSCVDLTERTLSDEAVRRHEVLSEYARDTMLLLGPDGEILEANSAAEKMYGYSHAELLTMRVRDLRAVEVRGNLSGDLQRAWTTGVLFETMHRRRDGSAFPVEVNSQATTVDGKRVLVSIIRDTTERHQMEQQLRASEAKYRSLFENIGEGVGIHELVLGPAGDAVDYRITDVNRAYCVHTGLTRAAVVGRLATEAYGVEVAPLLEIYARTVQTGRSETFETFFAPLNRHLAISAFTMGPGKFATVFSDVTERKRVEDQLRQGQKMEAVGRLAGGIAHDFNNLLTIILAYTQMLLESGGEVPAREALQSIHEAGERAARLTSQLLTFSRKQVIQPQVLDLNRLVSETGNMVRRIIGEDITLQIEPSANLKYVRADVGQIEQVILNLVVNARDAMPRGGRLTIRTSTVTRGIPAPLEAAPGGYVLLSVADTGVGMTPEVQSHLFEPFFTTKPKGQGTGLGLPTVYGIVKQSGGDILVETRPGKGTTFKIFLPAAVMPETAAEVGSRGSVAQAERGETILLAEDDRKIRELVAGLLTRLGYRVFPAADGMEALRLFAEHRSEIDLLMTDVVMPSMSGQELAVKVREVRPSLPVLFLSGYPDLSVSYPGVQMDAANFLQKPFTSQALSAKIREQLER